MSKEATTPVVSISCITYNQAPFIRECLESFLMQKTTFPFEILIHDDASTDGTTEIIKEYQAKYPDIIKPIFREQNLYSQGIRMINRFNYERAQGKYIALCEGDDFWSDPHKLQIQYEAMESDPDCSICYHDRYILDCIRGLYFPEPELPEIPADRNEVLRQILLCERVMTQCFFFRRDALERCFDDILQSTKNFPMGDLQSLIFLAREGKVKYLHRRMAVYRIAENSVSKYSKTPNQNNGNQQFIERANAGRIYLAKALGFPEWEKDIRDRFMPTTKSASEQAPRRKSLREILGKIYFNFVLFRSGLRFRRYIRQRGKSL